MLEIDGLCFGFAQRTLFSDFSARLGAGVTLVRGGDGRGKTTLVRLLAGALPPDQGEVRLNGISLRAQPALYRQQVFWVDPQTDACDQISALAYFKTVQAAYPGFDAAQVPALTEGLSLTPHLEKPMYMLSTGSRRKVWLAAAFASGAALTLLDGPFAALDKPSITYVLQMLHDAARHPARIWVVAHYEGLGSVPLAVTVDLGD
ncbi:MAG: transporter involved in cytochrome c biosis, ATPase component [Pseudomonadota bacterium]